MGKGRDYMPGRHRYAMNQKGTEPRLKYAACNDVRVRKGWGMVAQ